MSSDTIKRPEISGDWNLKGDLPAFLEAREEIGQQKYGRGKKNAAYKRDNLMDVIEEITDAITIFKFFLERFGKEADATSWWEVEKGIEARATYSDLINLTNRVFTLRQAVDGYDCTQEKIERAVALDFD